MKGILCFGDSITFGRGEVPSLGWCGRLKKWFESKDSYNTVYNLGIPGDNSQILLKKISIELETRARYRREEDYFTVILAIGTNDLKSDGHIYTTTIEQFKENIQKIISIIKTKVNKYYVLEIPPIDSQIEDNWEGSAYLNKNVEIYNQALKEVAKEHFIPLTFTDWNNKLTDGLHPNSQGYEDMYNQIKKLFE